MPGSATWTVYRRDPLRGRTCRCVRSAYGTASPEGNTGQLQRSSRPRLSKARPTTPRTREGNAGFSRSERWRRTSSQLSIQESWEQSEKGPKTIASVPKAQRRPQIIDFKEDYGYDDDKDVHM